MKIIKLYEEFNISRFGDLQKKRFDKPTAPEEPFKRKLTDEETKKMFKYFPTHSWCSSIDNQNRIILTGGEDKEGMFYITEDDLKKLK
jgi:hypothetical protein